MGRPERVFLIGPMGVGKSTIGRHLATLMQKEFLDSDQEIERRTGASVSLIFEIEGEAGFRRRETLLIDELSQRSDLVLATGGGAILTDDIRRVLLARGVVVYLHAPIDILVQRTYRDRNRPLLQSGDRRQKLEDIMKVREPIYRQTAHLIVQTELRSPQNVAREILGKLDTLEIDDHA